MTTPTPPPDPFGSGQPPAVPPMPPAATPIPPPEQPLPPANTPPPPGYPPAPAAPGTPPAQPGYAPPAYTTPPTTEYGAPPPAPAGPGGPAWGAPAPAPAGGGFSFDPKTVNPYDWGILGAGALAFLFSLFGFYTAKSTVNFGGVKRSTSDSASAWHEIFGGGFFGWFAMVFAVAAAVILALHLFAKIAIPGPLSPRQLVLGLFALAALFEILAIFIHPDFGSVKAEGFSASFGHGFSFWISLIVIIAGAVLAFLRLQQVGEKMPWEIKK